MRERGFTMLVMDVLNARPPARRRSEDRMARQIWRMEQEAIRFSLSQLGIPVVHWDGVQSLDLPLAGHTRLEVLHRARPWHTAVLGAALIAYLLATHLAESGAAPRTLRPQVRVLAAGAVLLALCAGAGMLPAAGPGPARPCCGWWRRVRSSPRPASSRPRWPAIGERSESPVSAHWDVLKARFHYAVGFWGLTGYGQGGTGGKIGDSGGTRKGRG